MESMLCGRLGIVDCYALWTIMSDDSCHVYVDSYMCLVYGMFVNFGC